MFVAREREAHPRKKIPSRTDARLEGQRGFDPVARYRQSGPWQGLGVPEQATGRRVHLSDAQASELGRLSARENTYATVEAIALLDFVAQLDPVSDWSALTRAREFAQRSLLAEPETLRDWSIVPNTFALTSSS